MRVTRIHEDPRVTKPYTDEQWKQILKLGDQIDAGALRRRRSAHHGRRADLRLHRRHGWRGVEHRGARAEQAAARRAICCCACATSSRPAACCTSGKANGIRASLCRAGRYTCYWRTDGVPLWHDPQWFADPDRDYGLRRGRGAASSPKRWRAGWRLIRSIWWPPTKIRWHICSKSASSRSTSIR